MERLATETTLGDWLQRYGRERPFRQQAARILDRLTDEFPAVFLSAATRLLTDDEVDEVITAMLAHAEMLVAGTAAVGRLECGTAAA